MTSGVTHRARAIVGAHPGAGGAVVLAAVALGVFAFLWFRPDKLFANKTVNEQIPVALQQPAPTGGVTQRPSLDVLSEGSFKSLEHETTGAARLLRLGDGRTIVRLENFRTSSGPDVIVILSDAPSTIPDAGGYDDGKFVSVGSLKANRGNQNYAVPSSVDPAKYRSIVVWCRRFTVAFGAAPLELKE